METPAHHFILGGFTYSMDGQVTGNAGSADGWLVEADENGNLIGQQCAGGTGSELMWMVCFLDSSAMLFSGTTDSNDGDVSGTTVPTIYGLLNTPSSQRFLKSTIPFL
jgi:hypothetical protein